MNVSELYSKLDERIPADLRCEWDNDGIMCMPNAERQVKKVLLTLDVTEAAVEYAIKGGFDLIVSHHPMIFKALKGITDDRFISLVKADISVFSFHTRFDKVEGGVNTALAELLGLSNTCRFGEDELGVIGELESEMSDKDLALKVKNILNAPFVEGIFMGRMCRRVAVVGGSGSDYIKAAREAGADFYLSGSLGYNDVTDAAAYGISIAAAGHFYTEQPSLKALGDMIESISPDTETEIFECNLICSI